MFRDETPGARFRNVWSMARQYQRVAPLAWHPENRNAVIMVDLQETFRYYWNWIATHCASVYIRKNRSWR